ncbi:MAG: LysE family translocator [Tateyamaria sp.]
MAYALFLLWITALPLVLSPGPANLSLASFGVSFGFRRSLPYLAGILSGTLGVLCLVATGLAIVILTQPALVAALKVLALLYICYLAWKIAAAPVSGNRHAEGHPPSAWQGLGIALANPKAFAALGAVYMGHTVVKDHALLDAAAKIVGLSAAIILSGVLWLAFGAAFSRQLGNPRVGKGVNVTFALLMVVSVGLAVSSV